jgi:hypothetical protein
MQFNGPGNNSTTSSSGPGNNSNAAAVAAAAAAAYAMEYRHSQQQHQVQQNLSVHSIPSSSSSTGNGNAGGFSRSGNYASNPQLPTKSPMLSHKQFLTPSGSNSASGPQSHQSPMTNGEQMLVDKSSAPKDSSGKHFPSKTYNHIKDMISSRFGGSGGGNASSGGGGQVKGLNNSVVNSVSATNGVSNNNNTSSANSANSYIDLTMGVPSSYPQPSSNPHHNQNGNLSQTTSSYNGPTSNGILTNRAHGQTNGQPYYPHNSQNGMMNGSTTNPPPNSYRSPNMNDRKNVNTSFRKAIQQSTLKSNLAEDSLQLRPIMESSQPQASYTNGRIPQYNGGSSSQQSKYDIHEAAAQERAQRALDQLMEGGGGSGPLQRNGSGPMMPNHSNNNPSVYNRIQQFQSSPNSNYPEGLGTNNVPNNYPPESSHPKGIMRYHPSAEPSSTGMRSSSYTKPGPASSNSNSSSGLAVIESSLSSPGSYSTNSAPHILSGSSNHHHLTPSTSANVNGTTSAAAVTNEQMTHGHSQWAHLHHAQNSIVVNEHQKQQQPPPLPTSQKPDSSQGSVNTIGLPCIPGETRENGDGSSGTMEAPSSANNIQHLESPSALCKSKSDTLKQITTDLQNIALSVAAEHHLHNNNNSSSSECEKGSQRVGSGQSHTTTDSGLGTVLLTKSPLNSNSDLGEQIEGRPNADSISSSKQANSSPTHHVSVIQSLTH